MVDPLEKRGEAGSTPSSGPIGLQLPFENHGSRITHCRPYGKSEKWYVELPPEVASSLGWSSTNQASYICTVSWPSLIGLMDAKRRITSGEIFLRRSDVRKCLLCGGIVVQVSTSPNTSQKSLPNSSSNESDPPWY